MSSTRRAIRAVRTGSRILAACAIILAAGTLSACGSADVTKDRLQASLPGVFSNLYVQQQADIGRHDITAATVDAANVSCDKGGPTVPDVGAGNDWICLMDFTNGVGQRLPQTKFEVKASSNGCYTVASSTKAVGPLNIDDLSAHYFVNKVFEFDGCFDTTE